ncbi:MAG: YgfZ/GcvT domain-containing protein [Burkholderiales bacterium]
MDAKVTHQIAELAHLGLLAMEGSDARPFLHAQLTNDVEHLAPGRARYAGWCSAKGRLLATFLVVAYRDRFLLQLARDLAPAVAKRLAMFILRSKVKLAEASEAWAQHGFWGAGAEARIATLGFPVPTADLAVTETDGALAVRIEPQRFLVLAPAAMRERIAPNAPADAWTLAEIRAGRPLIVQATQDQFVPQMVNLELTGGVDFSKGCYPGQEIVARAQHRGQVKRRMVRVRTPGPLRPGQDLFSDDLPGQPTGTVVNAAGDEALAVLQTSTVQSRAVVRAGADGAALEVLPLPYSQ